MNSIKNPTLALTMAVALLAISQIGETILLPAMPMMSAMLQTTPGQIQALVGIYLVCYGASLFVYGPLSDHYGRRPIILWSLVLSLIGATMASMSTDIFVLQMSTAIFGAGMGIGGLMCRTMLRDLYEGQALHRATSIVGIASVISPVIAPVLGATLLGWFFWQANYLFMAASIFVLFLMCYAFLEETNLLKGASRLSVFSTFKMYRAILLDRRFIGNTLCVSLNCASIFAYEVAAPFLLQEQCGLSPAIYAWVSIIPLGGFLIGTYASSYLGHRYLRHQITALGLYVALCAGLLMLGFAVFMAPTVWGIIVPMCVFFLGSGLLYAATSAEALMPFAKQAGVAGATLGGILNISSGLAAWSMSAVSITNAFPLGLELIMTTLVCFALLYRWIKPNQDRANFNVDLSDVNSKRASQ